MTTDTAQLVYAFIRDYRLVHSHAPDAHAAYQALGLTRREYVGVLRWLLHYGFLSRVGGEWRNAKVELRRCACGADITPASAAYTTVNGKLYLRRPCRRCYQDGRTKYVAAWRTRNPGYNTRLNRRLRQQRRDEMNRSAST